MKKILLFASALAGLFLAGSCQKETLEPAAQGGVTYEITLPDGPQTKGEAGYDVYDLHYEVYKTANADALATAPLLFEKTVEMTGNTTTLTLDLLNDQDYTVLFWANKKGGADFDLTDLRKVGVNTPIVANNDNRDAFCGMDQLVQHDGAQSKTVTLTRPFAQINIATLVPTKEKIGYDVTPTHSYVKVSSIPMAFNVFTGRPIGNTTAVEFSTVENQAPIPGGSIKVNNTDYNWVAMNYVLVPESVVEVEYQITTVNGIVKNSIPSVPVKKNYRTNIIGNLLTSNATYTIELVPGFEAPENVIGDEWTQTGNYTYAIKEGASAAALKEVLAHANAEAALAATKSEGPVVTIDLEGNVEWATEGGHGSSPLLPAESLISEVIINGNGKTFTATGAGVGSIRLANGGVLKFNNVNIVDESVSYNENAWEFTYLEFAGLLSFKDCTFNSGVQFQAEEGGSLVATFEGCHFITNEASVYGVWVSDGVTSFEGCTFEGTRGLKVHEAYGSEVTRVEVDGCEFGPISKKPGIALGDLNAETTIVIKNSKFVGCEGGMYETDTDVTTFEFVNDKNEVHANPSAMISEWVKDAQAGETVNIPAGEYTFPTAAFKAGVTLNCAPGTVFTGTSGLNINGATVIGATFENKDGVAVRGTIYGTFKNCTFDGSEALRWCYSNDGKEVVFEDCEIKTDFRGFHFDGMDGNVIFRRCKINGFNAYGGEGTATFENCVFGNDESTYNGLNTYSNTVLTDCQFNFISGKTNFIDMEGTGKTLTITNCTATLDGVAKPVTDFVGGSKLAQNTVILDGKTFVASQAALLKALKSGAKNIYLKAGNYELANSTEFVIASDEMVTIEGENKEGCVVKVGAQLRADGKKLTLKNLTTTVPTGLNYTEHTFAWIHHFTQFNMIGCNSDGRIRLNCYNANIEECNFNVTTSSGFDGYAIFYYGPTNSNVTVKDCVFTTVGKAIVMYNEGKPVLNLDVEDCEFTSSAPTDKAAIQMHTEYGISGTLDIVNCTATGFADVNGGLFNELNNNTKVPTNNFVVTIEGREYVAYGLTKEGLNYYVSNANGLSYFSDKKVADGTVITLLNDIDFNGAEFKAIAADYGKSFTFNGNNKTISNVKLITNSHNSVGSASLFFCYTGATINVNNLTVDKAISEGATYAGTILGYTQGNATLKNVTVKNSSINGVKKIGGLVGFVEASTTSFLAENCNIINTKVVATEKQAGTIIGYNAKPATLRNCTVDQASTATAPSYCDGGVRSTDPAQAELTIE